MNKDKVLFVIASEDHMPMATRMIASLRKFHSAEELPVVIIGPEELKSRLIDPLFYYRATPIIASELFDQGYKTVIKIDADSIITGDLSESWSNGGVDASVVLNSNPREWKKFQYTIWDIQPFEYINNGYVVLKNKKFARHWMNLCLGPHFVPYQMKEQDMLNIMCHYGDYMVDLLESHNGLWGLSGKGYEAEMKVEKNKLVLPPTEDGYIRVTKDVKIYHFAGGNDPQKGNYHTKFSEETSKWLDNLQK
jgi:lipopolysaccharide biosynthesis glycosyltransferase